MVHRKIKSERLDKFNDFLNKNIVPPYYKLFPFQQRLSNIPIFLRALLVGPLLYIIFYSIANILESNVPLNALFSMAILSGWISAFLVLNTNSYQKSIETISYIATMLVTDSQLTQLKNDLYTMLFRPTQTLFSLFVALIITLALVATGLDFPISISVIIYCFTFLTIFCGGYMLWMSFAALIWAVKFSNGGPYLLNHIPNILLILALEDCLSHCDRCVCVKPFSMGMLPPSSFYTEHVEVSVTLHHCTLSNDTILFTSS